MSQASSAGKHIDQYFTTLELNGGRDAFCQEIGGRKPDLLVHGGMLVQKTSCFHGLTVFGNEVTIEGNITVIGDSYLRTVFADEIVTCNISCPYDDLFIDGNVNVSGGLTIHQDSEFYGNVVFYGNVQGIIDVDVVLVAGNGIVIDGNLISLADNINIVGNLDVGKKLTAEQFCVLGDATFLGNVYGMPELVAGNNIVITELAGNAIISTSNDITIGGNLIAGQHLEGASLHILGDGTIDGNIVLGFAGQATPVADDLLTYIGGYWRPAMPGSTGGASSANYVFAYDTTQQAIAVIGTFQDVTFSNNGVINGWTHTPGSGSFVCSATGTYCIAVTAQTDNGGGGQEESVIRIANNGTEIPGSVMGNHEQSGAGSYSENATKVFADLNAGDVVSVQFAGTSTLIHIAPHAVFGTVIPSIQTTIFRIR